jgi:four helix bundle protein
VHCVRAVDSQEMRARAKQFAIRIVKYVQTLPRTTEAQEIGRQLLRAGTGVSGNYHSAGRARSRKEFIARLSVVLEEADEAEHWLDILKQSRIGCGPEQNWLVDEAGQLRAIYQKSVKTARANHPITK